MLRESDLDTTTGRHAGLRRALKWVAAIAGAVLTVALGSTAFVHWRLTDGALTATPRFSPSAFAGALTDNLAWLVPFVLLSAAMLPLRALQWQTTLDRPVRFSERWHFVNIGAAAHNLLPGNLGDVTRAFLLARTQQFPFLSSLGSVVVCKLLELAALVLLAGFALLLPYWQRMPELLAAMRWAAAASVALVVGLVAVAHSAGPIARWLEERGLRKLARGLRHVDEGLGAARSWRGMAVALAASVAPNAAAALAYGIGLEAIGVPHGILAGPLVLLVIAFGRGAPGVPTGPGVYLLVASWAARSLGAAPEDAAAYALVTSIATGLSQWVPGLISLAIRRVRWSELRRQTALARQEAQRARHA